MHRRLTSRPQLDDLSRQAFGRDPTFQRANVSLPDPQHFWSRPTVDGCTIDPTGCKDHDDAIGLQRRGDTTWVYISIADVSAFVQKDSILDRQAQKRGFSRYRFSGTEQMLTAKLAEHELSLHADLDRAAITIAIPFSDNGEVGQASFIETRLKSHRSYTYEQVDELLRGQAASGSELQQLCKMALQLASNRVSRSSARNHYLPFDLATGIIPDENGTVHYFRPGHASSHLIVQEFMIAANEAVAKMFTTKKVPAIFRNHVCNDTSSSPVTGDSEVTESFSANMTNRATYAAKNKGHEALGINQYVHFTSPIRRYSDLVNARQLRAVIRGNPLPYSESELDVIATDLTELQNRYRQEMTERKKRTTSVTSTPLPELSLHSFEAESIQSNLPRISAVLNTAQLPVKLVCRILFQPSPLPEGWADCRRKLLARLGTEPILAEKIANVSHNFGVPIQLSVKAPSAEDTEFRAQATIDGNGRFIEGSILKSHSRKFVISTAVLEVLSAWIAAEELKLPIPPREDSIRKLIRKIASRSAWRDLELYAEPTPSGGYRGICTMKYRDTMLSADSSESMCEMSARNEAAALLLAQLDSPVRRRKK